MLNGILTFEWRYHTRRLTFPAAAAFFILMGFMLTARGMNAPEVYANAPYALANAIGFLSLTCVFPITLFCAQSVLRDHEHRMAEMVYTTAVGKSSYLFGRFGGAFLATATTLAFALVGMGMGTYLVPHDPARIGPFDLLDYIEPFVLLALPNVLFAGAVLFAVAVISRSTLATYVGGVFLYVLYIAASMATNSPLMAQSAPPTPERLALAALCDPFGLAAFFDQTHYWTVGERNTQRLALEGRFLLNRLVWTGFALGLLAIVHKVFAFRLFAGDGKKEPVEETPAPARGYTTAAIDTEGVRTKIRAVVSATKLEWVHALKSWPFVVLTLMWIAVVGIDVIEVFGRAEFGTRLIPTTGLVLGRIQEPLGLMGLLALIYYSAELVWRERAVRMDEIVDASPASSAVFLLSKSAALALLVGVLTLAAIGVAALYQVLHGQPVEPGLYVSIFYFTSLPLVLVAILALFIQTLIPNRYAGMLATLVVVLLIHKGAFFGPSHPLLRYAAAPEVYFSAMNGFSPMKVSFTWFMVYWTSFAGLLALVSYGLWRRGTDTRLLPRLAGLPHCWGRGARCAVLACGLALVTTGLSVFYQTNVANAYETAEEVNDWKADYEKTYRHLEEEAEPTVAHIEVQMDLFPDERRYIFRGFQRLENRTDQAIGEIWVAVRDDVELTHLEIDGARLAEHDEQFEMYRFALQEKLEPGASTDLSFSLGADRRGVTAGEVDYGIVANGSFLLSPFLLPTVGYRFSRELQSPSERRRRGLPEHARPMTIEGAQAAGIDRYSLDRRVTFDTTVSTPADQIAVAPGELRKSWQEGGRRYFRYVAQKPVTPYFAYVSARYEIKRARHGDVEVEIYYHPEHAGNVDRFQQAILRSLEYCATQFGPYPYSYLRLVEIPAYWKSFRGLALPGVIYYVEDAGFLTDYTDPDNVDIVTKRVAHEVAHQWWGHQLTPAIGPGASTLVESLARYTELMVLKEMYGEAAIPPVLENELDRYLRGRTGQSEVPLYQVGRQPWLFYSKGAIVMSALADLVGEENVNRALSKLLAGSQDPNDPPDSLDLLRHLRGVTPQEHHELLDEWWKQIVLYDLSVESAVYEPTADGRYRVTIEVSASKSALHEGIEEPIDMDEKLDVALFSQHPNARGFTSMFHREKLRVRRATQLKVIVDERPEHVVLDPYLLRIEKNRIDNVVKVTLAGS